MRQSQRLDVRSHELQCGETSNDQVQTDQRLADLEDDLVGHTFETLKHIILSE